MKYVLLGVLLASIAGLQFAHELWSGDAPRAVCMAPEAQQGALWDMLLQHFGSH